MGIQPQKPPAQGGHSSFQPQLKAQILQGALSPSGSKQKKKYIYIYIYIYFDQEGFQARKLAEAMQWSRKPFYLGGVLVSPSREFWAEGS